MSTANANYASGQWQGAWKAHEAGPLPSSSATTGGRPLFAGYAITTAAVLALFATLPATATAAPANYSALVTSRVTPTSPSDQRRDVLASRIRAYADLEPDWDGDNGVPATPAAIEDALAFLDFAMIARKSPSSMIEGDGSVGFYWKSDDFSADVCFKGDGKIIYYAESSVAGIASGIAPFDRVDIPDDLWTVLVTF